VRGEGGGEESCPPKMVQLIFGRDFASENATTGGMWVQGGGTELPCKFYLHAPKKYKHSIRTAIRQKQ